MNVVNDKRFSAIKNSEFAIETEKIKSGDTLSKKLAKEINKNKLKRKRSIDK